MKKYVIVLVAVLAISGAAISAGEQVPAPEQIPSQQQEPVSWYDLGKQKLQAAGQTVGHYMPSWHYAPAIGAGLAGGISASAMSLGYPWILGSTSAGFKAIPNTNLLVLLYAAVPTLISMGWTIKQIEQFIRGSYPGSGSYKYYLPGILAGLYPWLFAAAVGGLHGSGLIDLNGMKPGDKYFNTIDILGALTSPALVSSPALFGAGHLAHQYFNPPVQAPIVPMLPEQMEEQQIMQPEEQELEY